LILECYWLARQYHQSPEVFLNMPLDQMLLHVRRTQELLDLMAPSQESEETDG
jgi:hypothetical protein